MCFAEIVACHPRDAGSRPVPIGSRCIGVSLQPAIPRRVAPQQSPLPLHQSPRILAQSQSGEAIKWALNFRKDAAHAVARRWVAAPALAVSAANPSVISTLRGGCHFYLAPTIAERAAFAVPRRNTRIGSHGSEHHSVRGFSAPLLQAALQCPQPAVRVDAGVLSLQPLQ